MAIAYGEYGPYDTVTGQPLSIDPESGGVVFSDPMAGTYAPQQEIKTPNGYQSEYVRWAGGAGQPVEYKRPDGTWVSGGMPEHAESAAYLQKAFTDPQVEKLFKFAYEHPGSLNNEQKAFMANPVVGLDSLGQGSRWGSLNLFDDKFNPQQAGALMQTGSSSYLSESDIAAGGQFNQEQSPAAQSARDDSGGFGDLLPLVVLIGVGIATGGFGLAAGAVEAGAAAGLTVGEAASLAAADAMAGIGAAEFGVGAALEGAGALAGSAAAAEAALPMSQVGALSNASTFGTIGSGSMDLAVTGGLESGFGIGSAAAGTAPGMGALGSGLAGTTAAEVGTASIAPGLMSSIGAGAARGAITSAITGGDPIKGAMTGGITGGLMNTVGPVDTGLGQTADVAASAALRGAIGGGASAAISGGSFSDVLESSAIGGIVGGVTAGATELARSELPASELTGAFSGAVGGAAGGVTNALLTGGDAATQALIGGAAGGAGGLMSDIGLPSLAGIGSAVTGSLVGDAISQEPEQAPVQQPPSVVQEPTTVANVSWGDFVSPQFINIPRKDMNWGERVPWGQS